METAAQNAETQDVPYADPADDGEPERVPLPDGSGNTLTYVNDEQGLTSIYTYNNYGNLTSLVRNDGTEEQRQTYTYSSDGAFLVSSTDDIGKVTEYQYSNGRLVSATSGGKTKSYFYQRSEVFLRIDMPYDWGGLVDKTLLERITISYCYISHVIGEHPYL